MTDYGEKVSQNAVMYEICYLSIIFSNAGTSFSHPCRVHSRSRLLRLEEHVDWRLRVEDGHVGAKAGQSAGQDLRGARRLRLLRHLQHRSEVKL